MGDPQDTAAPGLKPREALLLEWARRHADPQARGGNALADLVAGRPDDVILARRGLPRATLEGIRGYYDQIESGPQLCDGTACHFAGAGMVAERLGADGSLQAVRCLGHCYAAPSFRSGMRIFAPPHSMTLESWLDEWGEAGPLEDIDPIPRSSLVEQPVVLRNVLAGPAADPIARYQLPDGATLLAAVDAAGLRGRGGAAFPTAAKWRTARDTPAPDRIVVANGDEGDPGSFIDRLLLEEDPHAILGGMLGCARAIGARRGVVYIRAEYPRAQVAMRAAVEFARAAGYLGPHFDVEVMSGAGSYVCGEETALLRSIEGLRGEPRPKPPYPAEVGLFGLPTVVQNVETLAVVDWVAREARVTGTKAVCLSGAVARTGVVEVALGTPLGEVLERGGGGAPPGRRWKMALIGGPMGRVLPASRFDTPLSYEGLPGMGHAGVVVFDESVSARALAEHLFTFARAESCGTCAPCRIGTSMLAGAPDRPRLERLLETLEMGSLCGFGQGVPRPIRDLLDAFGDEVFA